MTTDTMTKTKPLAEQAADLLSRMGVDTARLSGGTLDVRSPIDGSVIASVSEHAVSDVDGMVEKSVEAFKVWRALPAPRRGELVRRLGEVLRMHKDDLGLLVSLEAGKIISEGQGEVQEMIDICDFATGLSRQLYGLTIASERPGHRMMETWHPIGPVGIISAFNFPVAVWSWNAALALVCGNSLIWKPSEKTPLVSMACQALLEKALEGMDDIPANLSQLLIGDAAVGQAMVDHHDVPLISATGSTAMGRKVGPRVAERFGRSLLELGGNNAMIVTETADLELAVRGIVFSAAGTAGQRCTTLRRLIVHEDIYDQLVPRLVEAYKTLPIGSPLEDGTLVGPIIDERSYHAMKDAIAAAKVEGGKVHGGHRALKDEMPDAYYVAPAIIEMPEQSATVKQETFAPIMYVMKYRDFDDAVEMQNDVPQGLASSVFTMNMREAERFVSPTGSDCGIANVNIGPSGAEIGGAFGGEKETGGGRESGSDSWRAYMRRQTNTINYSTELPLAQGVKFV
ncbi:MAG: aldehyde dehydrogenase family protein [Alphaproteobacteria bacterium]